jgi:hypothetical protein
MTILQRHPLSALFSRFDLAGDDLQALATDIKGQGQHSSITMHEGMVLDGWNRYQACLKAKVRPKTSPLKPGTDPWSFVCSSNMHRRHMSPTERVTVMNEYLQMLAVASSAKGEDRSKLTVDQIEKTLDVSHGTAVKAAQVARAADPDVAEALAKKEISLDRAAEVSKLPEGERKDAIKAAPAPKAKDDRDARISELTRLLADANAEKEALRDQNRELASSLRSATEDNESMDKILRADNSLMSLMNEVGKFKELARVTKSRNDGLMVEVNQLKGFAKSWKRKFDLLERKTKGLEAEPEEELELETRPDESDYHLTFDEVG